MTSLFPQHTASEDPGRFVVVFDAERAEQFQEQIPRLLSEEGFSTTEYFPRLGIAVVSSDTDHLNAFSGLCREQQCPMDYSPALTYHAIDQWQDTEELTWGLQAVGVTEAEATGTGVRLAVLDTGFAADHPDYADRDVVTESFIDGEDGADAHGHGTHCIGTAAGSASPPSGPRYGVATGATIYSGKVLGNDGSGSDSSVLAGIEWALENECQVINMSLGADVREVHPPYVAAGRRALELGCLIVAAAGNNARRSEGDPGFVGAPANSPFIMAVGAVDNALNVADFSARSLPGEGGEVDLCGPGVDVLSSWPLPETTHTISGTSMAAPHVSGVAALLFEETGLTGQELWDELIRRAESIDDADPADVGAGLVKAPAAPDGEEGP